MSALKPEQQAREQIDKALVDAGWLIQDREEMNIHAGPGVAVREFRMSSGHGFADYLLFVDGKPVGALEAKPAGCAIYNVEVQIDKYANGLPPGLNPPVEPLPFLYISTGVETGFINLLDHDPKTRTISANLPHIHQPGTLRDWIRAATLDAWVKRLHEEGSGLYTSADDTKPSSFRSRISTLPPLDRTGLYPNQIEAVENLDVSLKRNRPRALIQMATGSGKTITAITAIYRLIKYAGARRVLFLVDRTNLGEQAEKEFQGYRVPDSHRLFTELYNVQLLKSNTIMDSSRVVIGTIQRVYSMLKGEPDLDPLEEAASMFESAGARREPLPVVYNAAYPPEFFDVVVIDEVHRSIYTLWRQVVEYFDAFLVGLTATPSKQTLGFFNKNLVMEYDHERAVADGVNVDFEVYNIRTKITSHGSTVEAKPDTMLGYRHKQTRALRWEKPDEDLTYDPNELDRKVVAKGKPRVRSAVGGRLHACREENRNRSARIDRTAIERSAWSSTIPRLTGSSECLLVPRRPPGGGLGASAPPARVPALPFVRTASRLSPAFAGSRGWGLLVVPGLAPWATLCPAACAASCNSARRGEVGAGARKVT
jgi:type I restriction enzyme, R subunit